MVNSEDKTLVCEPSTPQTRIDVITTATTSNSPIAPTHVVSSNAIPSPTAVFSSTTTTAPAVNSLQPTTNDAMVSACANGFVDAIPGQGNVASNMPDVYTQPWMPQNQVQNATLGFSSTQMPTSKSSEKISMGVTCFPGLPNSAIFNNSPNAIRPNMHIHTQSGQTENGFLNSTQINSGTLPRTAPIIYYQPHVPFSAIGGYTHNYPQNESREIVPLSSYHVTQNSLCYSTALPQSLIETVSAASTTNVTPNRANIASNHSMFEGTRVYSQHISSTVNAHNNSSSQFNQPGLTSTNNANILYNNSGSQFKNSANVTMSSSQIAARHVISKDLPSFSGKPDEWPVFITNYYQSTDRCGFTDQENLIRLQKCLKGSALEAVRGQLMMPSTVNLAIETLRMLFGRVDVIHHALQTKLRAEPKVRADNLNTLISLALAVQNYCSTIQAIGLSDYLNDPMLLNELLSKLPANIKLDWGRHCISFVRANLHVFDQWLFSLATCASQVTTFGLTFDDASEEKKTSNKKHGKDRLMFHDVVNESVQDENETNKTVPKGKSCLKCCGEHKLSECSQFISLKVDDRWKFVPVTLLAKQNSIDTWALIDEGAACTLIESDIAIKLGLDGPSEELCLRWTGDVTKSYIDAKTVSVDITSRECGSAMYTLKNVRTITSLDLPEQSLDNEMIESCKYLQDLQIKAYKRIKPTIIIGLDNAKLGVQLEIREGGDDDLMAATCRLGWSVYGRKHASKSSVAGIFHICDCTYGRQEAGKIYELLQQYFSLESVGVSLPTKPLLSADNERALKIMECTTIYRPEEKRWYTGLLWKYDQVELPNSLPMARRRLKCLEAKMIREPSFKRFLVDKLQESEHKGYIRKLENCEVPTGGKSWYIPIFTVTNMNKNKTRLVWDAAAKVNGIALNTFLLKDPDLLKSLVGVLLRFREKPVAICGDIREMFHQVKVISEDQMSQMFLWRGGDTSKDIDVYCMQVMTFGASCSPTLANYIKNKNANRFIRQYPSAVKAIIDNTVVDDWHQSCQTEEEMIELAVTVRDIHKDGGFEMRNWISNSTRVLENLTGKQVQLDKCIQESEPEHEKLLGMWWLPHSDEFTFVQKFDSEIFEEEVEVTKRQILRIIMKIFDPLGILGYFLIHAKITLQDVWRSGVSWDEPIKESERKRWFQWLKYIPFISNIRIPRNYSLVSESQNIQLHVFVDASNSAYAAVAYIRAQVGSEVNCSLVASKTRVAPLKPISIPRMELMAAIIGLRLASFIEKEQSIKIDRRIFWSDSKDVLYWIRSDARKFKQFVALRIGEILEKSNVNEWRWSPSAENVADEGTKWSNLPVFDSNIRWFSGPAFLNLDEEYWPTTTFGKYDQNYELLCHIEENQKHISIFADISPDSSRFSKWEKLRWTQTYILRFLKLLFKRQPTSPLMKMLINVNDICGIESVIFRNCQEESYGEEIYCLNSEANQVSRKSSLFKCSPYLDEMGVLRIKGRIDAVEGVGIDVKRPIILPRVHAVTHLVVDFYHRRFHHHHNEIVVNELRQRYWIPGLRALVRSVAKKCQVCKNRRATPASPEMGDLPPERLAAFTRPFTYTGIDYFGPFDVIVGRRREKRWGVLFTCLTVRAVHLEISPSLSTDSFMLVFKQFVSRRGTPKRILSDNGTNFRGSSRLLANEVEKISGDELNHSYPEIEWLFIPPASPHMGGAWERMVRSVKSILMEILPKNGLREEVLRAAMADVENIINSRPLTYIPLESTDAEAITPNHFLIGCSSGICEKGSEKTSGVVLLKNFKIAGQLADQFWKRWLREYLSCLTRRSKWFSKSLDPIDVNDVVIVVDDTSKRGSWLKGIVVDVHRSKDKQVRSAVVRTMKGLVTRPVVKLAKLDIKK